MPVMTSHGPSLRAILDITQLSTELSTTSCSAYIRSTSLTIANLLPPHNNLLIPEVML